MQDINEAPRKAKVVPNILIPPDIPFSKGLKFNMLIGLLLLNTPISEAQVSALASAKETA